MSGRTFQSYYLDVDRIVADLLANEKPEDLAKIDFEEYLTHLVERFERQPLEWDEGAMTAETFLGREMVQDFRQMIEVTAPRVRLRIPFKPHPQRQEFLDLMPSTQHSGGEPRWRFEGDTLVLETKAEDGAVARALGEVHFWIGGRNNDVREGNSMLRTRIGQIWKRKRAEIEQQYGKLQAFTAGLKIPLYQSPTAPKPIAVPPRKAPAPKPILKPATPEPELVRTTVLELVDFVETYAMQFEVSPRVYSKLEEEDLRDLVLGMLNVNYPGSSGETFSKKGKTDLFLRAEGGGSLIAECKRWTGPKAYEEALEQLFGYLTWRHSYAVLLTFCTTKNMTASAAAAQERMAGHASVVASSIKSESASRFASRHLHPQDQGKTVEVFHLFVDLAV